jgi:thiol-disulfide isomerase/thioredoxin
MTSDAPDRAIRRRGLILLLGLALAVPSTVFAQAPPSPAPPDTLKVGDTVRPFDAEGLDGVFKHVDYKGSTTILLFFLSGCPHCHKMIPEWNRAFERRPKGLNVLGVLLDKEPPGFFMATPTSFPVLRAPAGDFARQYKIRQVPLTARVAAGGVVADIIQGEADPIRLGELFRP